MIDTNDWAVATFGTIFAITAAIEGGIEMNIEDISKTLNVLLNEAPTDIAIKGITGAVAAVAQLSKDAR